MNFRTTADHVLTVDPDRHEVMFGDHLVDMTPTEFVILEALCRNCGRLVTYDSLANLVWGPRRFNEKRALEVQVSRIRAKISDVGGDANLIQTIRGFGFKFACEGQPGWLASFRWDPDFTLLEAHVGDTSIFPQVEGLIGTRCWMPTVQYQDLTVDDLQEFLEDLFRKGMVHLDGPVDLVLPDGSVLPAKRCSRLKGSAGALTEIRSALWTAGPS